MTERPTDTVTEARLRAFLAAELAQAHLDYPDFTSRRGPRPNRSFAPFRAASLVAVVVLVGAGLITSRGLPALLPGSAAAPTSAAGTCVPEDLSAFLASIQNVTYDYEPFDSPRAQSDAADLVVVGRFVAAGPRRSGDSRGQQRGQLTVAVETVIAGNRSVVQDGHVLVELPMQPSDIEIARDSLPANRVMLFLDSSADPSIFAPFVQGVVLETCPGYVSALDSLESMEPAWREAATFDEFVVLASPTTSSTVGPDTGSVSVGLRMIPYPPDDFPPMGNRVGFLEIRRAGGGELLHDLRLRDEVTTIELAPGLYAAAIRVHVEGDVILEGKTEPELYDVVARCGDIGLEILSGSTAALQVTIQETDGACQIAAG